MTISNYTNHIAETPLDRARTRATRDARVVPFADLLAADDDTGDAILESRFTPDGRWSEPPARWQVNTPEALLLKGEVMGQLEAALETLPWLNASS
jgi:hypothetical protein